MGKEVGGRWCPIGIRVLSWERKSGGEVEGCPLLEEASTPAGRCHTETAWCEHPFGGLRSKRSEPVSALIPFPMCVLRSESSLQLCLPGKVFLSDSPPSLPSLLASTAYHQPFIP